MDSDSIDRHKQYQYCTNRLQYRASKKLTAVKVYSVASESKYLLVFGVPKINLRAEIKREFEKYGTVVSVTSVTNELSAACNRKSSIDPITDDIATTSNVTTATTTTTTTATSTTENSNLIEIFTDCFKVVFENIENARRAKRSCDTKNFYGGILHISYAPEFETIDDLAEKLNKRKHEVEFRNNVNKKKRQKQESGGNESLVWQRSEATTTVSSSTSTNNSSTITQKHSFAVHNNRADGGEPKNKRKKFC